VLKDKLAIAVDALRDRVLANIHVSGVLVRELNHSNVCASSATKSSPGDGFDGSRKRSALGSKVLRDNPSADNLPEVELVRSSTGTSLDREGEKIKCAFQENSSGKLLCDVSGTSSGKRLR